MFGRHFSLKTDFQSSTSIDIGQVTVSYSVNRPVGRYDILSLALFRDRNVEFKMFQYATIESYGKHA